MKPFTFENHVPPFGLVVLFISSLILSLVIGVSAYFISTYIYFIIIYSMAIGLVALISFNRLLQSQKVRNSILTAFIGLCAGTIIIVSYYGTPYVLLRKEFITDAKETFQINDAEASEYFELILQKETGSGGFPGYMKLRAKEGDEFTHYTMFNGATVGELHFTLKSEWAWTYWLLEYLIISIGLIVTGYYAGQQPFNISANEWYGLFPAQLGIAPLEKKEEIFTYLQEGKLNEFAKMIIPEGEIPHPVIEIYEQHSKNNEGDVLITIKETIAYNGEVKKRKILGRWEMPKMEFANFKANISYNNAKY